MTPEQDWQIAQEVKSLPEASQGVVRAYLDKPAVRKRIAIWSAYLHCKELMKRGISKTRAVEMSARAFEVSQSSIWDLLKKPQQKTFKELVDDAMASRLSV